MGLNKRKEEKSFSIDTMLAFVNYDFIHSPPSENTRHYVISPTCFVEKEKRWLLCDGRADDRSYNDLLPEYYGKTITEAVTKCFLEFRKKNG
jgi:hypothetical protein